MVKECEGEGDNVEGDEDEALKITFDQWLAQHLAQKAGEKSKAQVRKVKVDLDIHRSPQNSAESTNDTNMDEEDVMLPLASTKDSKKEEGAISCKAQAAAAITQADKDNFSLLKLPVRKGVALAAPVPPLDEGAIWSSLYVRTSPSTSPMDERIRIEHEMRFPRALVADFKVHGSGDAHDTKNGLPSREIETIPTGVGMSFVSWTATGQYRVVRKGTNATEPRVDMPSGVHGIAFRTSDASGSALTNLSVILQSAGGASTGMLPIHSLHGFHNHPDRNHIQIWSELPIYVVYFSSTSDSLIVTGMTAYL